MVETGLLPGMLGTEPPEGFTPPITASVALSFTMSVALSAMLGWLGVGAIAGFAAVEAPVGVGGGVTAAPVGVGAGGGVATFCGWDSTGG
ncbi:MAG: hypothetical protein EXR78_07455 [Deltaproteobacteria bacterium]|nr:hypothetical protein [Deltaproteobacteria bacterium]